MYDLGPTARRIFAPCFCSSFSHIPSHLLSYQDSHWLYPNSTHHLSQAAYVSCMQDSPRSGEQRSIKLSTVHSAYPGTTIMHTMIHVNIHAASCKRHWQEQSLSRTLDAMFRILPSSGLSTLSDLRSGVACMIVAIQLEVRISYDLDLILAGLPAGTPTSFTFYLASGYLTAS